MTNEYKTEIVEKHWSKTDGSASERNFYCFPPIRERSCRLIFNEHDAGRRDWCEYWTVEKYFKDRIPVEKCLSICCGFGEVERILSRLNVARKIIGTDIAPGAIDQARKKAAAEGLANIEYFTADINKEGLPPDEFDIIWANGALHHIRDLEVVIPRLKNALKTGGFLISNEYVGSNYQQLGARQQEIINAVRHLLPGDLCRKSFLQGKRPGGNSVFSKGLRYLQRKLDTLYPNANIYGKIWAPLTRDHFLRTDPSECVNSERIIPELRKHFTDMDVKYYDGSILMYALDAKFYQNYNADNPVHGKLLDLLFRIEDTFIASGELPRDNAHIICRKT